MTRIPRLYPILDLACFVRERDPVVAITRFGEELLRAGISLIQFRDKSTDIRRMLSCARELRRITESCATLIINDRLDICVAAAADGLHLGQDDLSPSAVRPILNQLEIKEQKSRIIGVSTHNLKQVEEADGLPIDYLAIGPVFATSSKANPDPVIGLEGVRQARTATSKPLVAIGGITRKNCREAMDAGADAVAVISDLLQSPVKAVEEFLGILG